MSPEETETPTDDEAQTNGKGLPPLLYFALSLVLLAFALGGLFWLRANPPEVTPTPMVDITPTVRPLPTGDEDVPGDAFGLVAGPATPWAVPGGPGETPTAESPTAAAPTPTPMPIPLLGPPPGSFFRLGDAITFYWSAAAEPGPNQQYALYLLVEGERVLLGSVAQPNLGQGYQLQVAMGDFVEEPGAYSWLVVLEEPSSGGIIGQSDSRPITLMAD